jgi:signal transduction histidine kinase
MIALTALLAAPLPAAALLTGASLLTDPLPAAPAAASLTPLALSPAAPAAALLVAAIAGAALALRAILAARALRERAARVAHEVRGPLCAAHLALHGAARRGEVAPTLVAALELELRRAALALEDPATARPADVDLHALLTCQVRTWRDVAAAHDATLTLEPGVGTALIHADALRVAQATSNVLANAIEHGGGPISIRTRLIGDRIRVEVADNGPGLPASIAELTRRPSAGHGTRGRGLAIATAVLAHCNGRLTSLPSGSGVAIELPLSLQTEPA